jgi:membrane-associated phospholipid phosphatase
MLRGIQPPRQQEPSRQAPGRGPLLSPALRRPAALVVAGCAAVTALLGLAFAHQGRPDRLDAAVDTWVRGGLGRYHGPVHLLAELGGLIPVAVLTAALVLACLAARWWRGAALAALGMLAAVALTEAVLKPLVGRTIDGYPSFPSGHATALFGLAATCAVLLAGPSRPRLPGAVRLALILAAVLVAAAVAAAVIVLSYHYFTDTVAGTAVGTGTVLLTALLLDRARPAAAPRPPQR